MSWKEISTDETYYIMVNSYLANGGDNMNFLLNPIFRKDSNLKLRDLFINYLKSFDFKDIYKPLSPTIMLNE